MAVRFDYLLVAAHDKHASAQFFAEPITVGVVSTLTIRLVTIWRH